MRPNALLVYILAGALDEDRRRDEERVHAHRRAMLEARGEHPSSRARLVAALRNLARRDDHSLTDYPCRLPNGSIGRVAVVQSGGDWMLVCRVA